MSLIAAALLVLNTITAAHTVYVVPPAGLNLAPYPEWAHYHWLAQPLCVWKKNLSSCFSLYDRVWLSNDRASQASMTQYAQEYLDHGIEVCSGHSYYVTPK